MTQAWAMAAALAFAAAACGKRDGGGASGGAACAAAVARVRQRLAAVPAPGATPGAPPRTLAADGAGRTAGAVVVRFVERGDVQVQVGAGEPRLAGGLGSTDAVLADVTAQLATAPARVVELEVFADLSPVPVHALLTRLEPAAEVRLVVEQLAPPPREGVAPWATELIDGLPKVPGDQRAKTLFDAVQRAIGPRCFEVIRKTGEPQAVPSPREALPRLLELCGCAGSDVPTAAWLHEIVGFPTYQPAWLRLRLDTGGIRLSGMRTMQAIAGALEVMRPDERARGVWIVP